MRRFVDGDRSNFEEENLDREISDNKLLRKIAPDTRAVNEIEKIPLVKADHLDKEETVEDQSGNETAEK